MILTLEDAKKLAAQNILNRPAGRPGRLSGKITVITGAAQGFGKGLAELLHAEGARVVIADLPSQHMAAQTLVTQLGADAVYCPVDVTQEEMVQALVCFTVAQFGGLDLFLANAGILKAGALSEMSAADFELVTKVNYTGYFLCAKYAAEIMRAQSEVNPDFWGDIIQINSKSGLEGSAKNAAYSGGKFGGIGLTQSLARELVADQIKVNAVCPGNFYDGPLWSDPENGLFVQYLRAGKVPGAKTVAEVREFYLAKSPIRRGCYPQDVARAVLYCVEQQFETGQALPVTGGQNMLK